MIEVHRSTDGKPIYINIDCIESVIEDKEHITLTTIRLVGNNGIDCIIEKPTEIVKRIKNARWERNM